MAAGIPFPTRARTKKFVSATTRSGTRFLRPDFGSSLFNRSHDFVLGSGVTPRVRNHPCEMLTQPGIGFTPDTFTFGRGHRCRSVEVGIQVEFAVIHRRQNSTTDSGYPIDPKAIHFTDRPLVSCNTRYT